MAIKITPTEVPNKKSTAIEWITWHTALKSSYGKKAANYLFSKAWNKRGGANSNANTAELRNYLEKNGLVIDKSWTASVSDSASGVLDIFGDMFQVGKYAGIAIGIIVIGGAGLLIYNVAKNPIGAANAAAKLRGGIK